MSNPNGKETPATVASTAPAVPVVPAPMFNIVADSPRELALKAAQAILQLGEFEPRTTNPEKSDPSKYLVWNLDDSGKIGGYNAGITLTAEEAKMFPTTDGLPIVFSGSFVLRQLTHVSAVPARLAERRVAMATADANRVAKSSDTALLAELNKRRMAQGLKPITE